MDSRASQIQDLFNQFLRVCNKAMEAHKDEFPYKHIWEAAEHMQGEGGMHVTLYDDEPKGDYQLKIQDKHIEVMREGDGESESGWRLNASYLRQVVENPDIYINEPSKLDWHWLKNRSGLDF